MKIACNKCLKVEDEDLIKDWLSVKTTHRTYLLCPNCLDGFWMAVDSDLPKIPIKKEKTK